MTTLTSNERTLEQYINDLLKTRQLRGINFWRSVLFPS